MSNSSSNISTIQNKLATLFSKLESMTKSNDHMRIATLAELDKLLSELMEAFLEAFFKPLSAGLHSKSSDKISSDKPNETLQVLGVDNESTKKLAQAMLEEIFKLPVLDFENESTKERARAMLEEIFKSHLKSNDKTNKIQVSQLQRPLSASSLRSNISMTSHSKELKRQPSATPQLIVDKNLQDLISH